MSKGFFDYIEHSTWQEKDEIADELKAMYNRILEDEQELFADVRDSKRDGKAKHRYLEAVQRVGTIQGVFDILHIEFECGRKFALENVPFH